MTAYEKMLRVMRRQGEKNNPTPLQIGEMGENGSCRVGNLTLEAEDLLKNEMLSTGYSKPNGSTVGALKKGDTVLVQRLSEEQYAIICRLI